VFKDSIMCVADRHKRSRIAELSRLLRYKKIKRVEEAGLKLG
jgi:hypothetical protein